jgi:RNase P subunit RPR2
MTREFCPNCKAMRNVQLTTSRRKVRRPDGKDMVIVTKVLDCEACGSFIRSEDAATGAGERGKA